MGLSRPPIPSRHPPTTCHPKVDGQTPFQPPSPQKINTAQHNIGNVVWSVVAPLAIGSLAGSYFGGKELALRVRL